MMMLFYDRSPITVSLVLVTKILWLNLCYKVFAMQ